jgi:hypothetical protein
MDVQEDNLAQDDVFALTEAEFAQLELDAELESASENGFSDDDEEVNLAELNASIEALNE